MLTREMLIKEIREIDQQNEDEGMAESVDLSHPKQKEVKGKKKGCC